MKPDENNSKGLIIFLHFYTPKAYLRKEVVFFGEEKKKLLLLSESMETAADMPVYLEREGQLWRLNGKSLSFESYVFLKTKAGEEVMTVISKKSMRIAPGGKILLCNAFIKIGKSYQNDIFYDCFSLMHALHFQLKTEKEGCFLETEREDAGLYKAQVYVNSRAIKEKQVLRRGDVIEILGLSMMYLEDFLVCTSFYGTFRIAEGKRKLPVLTEKSGIKAGTENEEVLEEIRQEKELHRGEFEIDLPEPERKEKSQPVFLSAGPSVTMILPILMMAFAGSRLQTDQGTGYYTTSLVLTGSAAFLSLFWGITNHCYRKIISKKENQERKETYREYLSRTACYLENCQKENRTALLQKYPSANCFLQTLKKETQPVLLSGRSPLQEDFLFFRLGTGNIPFQMSIKISEKRKGFDEDLLVRKAYETADAYRLLKEAPIGIDLRKNSCIGFDGNAEIYEIFAQLLLQTAVCCKEENVKIAYFYNENIQLEKQTADCIKWLPHSWDERREIHFLAGNEKEAGEILPYLKGEILRKREEDSARVFYIFAVADMELIREEGMYQILMEEKSRRIAAMIFLRRKKGESFQDCSCLVMKERKEEELLFYEKGLVYKQKAALDGCSLKKAEEYLRKIAACNRKEKQAEEFLPGQISFLQLFACSRVEELNVKARWRENKTAERMKVPIGMGQGRRLLHLDIHEKFHGPHGLVAGTTGSGKSELLQTLLLSLSLCFSPADINFFVIDYKGGGMGNALKRLPHCGGVISNLSGKQIKRALLAVKGENKRRQEQLSLAGVNHIEDYRAFLEKQQEGQPMPHLILVVDEFAELKREEPEFMQEIISVAQVGRSLGVHLILATQKPAGTVDDKIWSNSNFRLCLRVQDKQDSMEMLHRPEAAYLTKPGQCYLQVGNNEVYQLFQTGYSAAEYTPDKHTGKGPFLISGTGKRQGEMTEKIRNYPTQTEKLIDYIEAEAGKEGYPAAKALWLPQLPERLTLKEADSGQTLRENRGEAAIMIGLCDDVLQQKQYPLRYCTKENGNLALCGAPATGKSTFLQTFLWQLCSHYSPKQVRFLLMSSQSAGVNCFEKMPHCMGNLKSREGAECFFYQLKKLYKERKEMLSGIGFDQYIEKKKKSPEQKTEMEEALIFLIIDGYGSFRQMTQDKYQPFIESLAGEGINYGIYLCITALGIGGNEIPGRLFEKFKDTLSLEMSDKFQYGDVLRQYHIPVTPEENQKGRGLCRRGERILEFQVLLIDEMDDYERIEKVEKLADHEHEKLSQKEKASLIFFSSIPRRPVFEKMLQEYEKSGKRMQLPIGYSFHDGNIKGFPMKEEIPFLISGQPGAGKRKLLLCLLEGLCRMKKKTVLIDPCGITDSHKQPVQQAYSGQSGQVQIISGKNQIKEWFETKENSKTIMIVLSLPGKETELIGTPIYDLCCRAQWGIHLGGNAAGQRILDFGDLDYSRQNQREEPGIGYLKMGPGAKTERIKLPEYREEKDRKDESENDIGGYSCSFNGQNV